MRIARWLGGYATVALAVASLAGQAQADPKTQRADQLFLEGKALLTSNLLQACEKFDQSLHENPAAIGTLMNVALCDEKLGRFASAFARFTEARDRAKEQGLLEHQRAAESHLATLRPQVPHLALTLTEPLPETRIVVDDQLIAPDSVGDIAVDPGERAIIVSAPERLPYRTKLVISPTEHRVVVIPALAKSVTVTSSSRRIGQISTIVGGTALGTAIGLGFYAHHLYRKPFDDGLCHGNHCTADGQLQTEHAHTVGTVGTVVGVIGVVVAGVGGYLWYRSPSTTQSESSDNKLTLVPQIGAEGLGVAATGRF